MNLSLRDILAEGVGHWLSKAKRFSGRYTSQTHKKRENPMKTRLKSEYYCGFCLTKISQGLGETHSGLQLHAIVIPIWEKTLISAPYALLVSPSGNRYEFRSTGRRGGSYQCRIRIEIFGQHG
jgi:hypothetical protein